MQLKFRIIHAEGCYTLVANGLEGTKDRFVQSSFYAPGNRAEREAALEQLRVFTNGVVEGFNLARQALHSPHYEFKVEELEMAR